MPDLALTRRFDVDPQTLFDAVTRPDLLVQWWGPVGVSVDPDSGDVLDFTRLGPWGSVMVNGEGKRFKVTGQVTHLDPPRSVGFTWAWHDDADARGPESHVTLSVDPDPEGGSLLRLSHVALADAEAASNHEEGWTSSLTKIDALFQPHP